MKIVGITGGVGAGKSTVLEIINNHAICRLIVADEVAKDLERPGQKAYNGLVELLSEDILSSNGEIDKKLMAAKIFSDKSGRLIKEVNALIHPLVKEYILDIIEQEKKKNKLEYLIIEAALLIEDGYTKICDELWYVYADEEVRRHRLIESRGYSEQKIADIMGKQCDDSTFRKYCKYVIENNGDLAITKNQIEEIINNNRRECSGGN